MRVALDFHDVLADLKRPVVALLNARYDLTLSPDDLRTWKCWESGAFSKKQFYDAVNSVRNAGLDPLPGAVDGLRELLADGHDVSIVSGTREPMGVRRWLDRHGLPALPVYGVVADDTHRAKLALGFDVYVDDNPQMAERVGAPVVIFDQPWNRELGYRWDVLRATSWPEVVAILRGD